MIFPWQNRPVRWYEDYRQQMIAETSLWLTRALRANPPPPRIPTRRVDLGGFASLIQAPAARAAVFHWWGKTLDVIDRLRS